MRYAMKLAAACVAAISASGISHAAIFSLSLTGDVSNFTTYSLEFNNKHYDTFDLSLDGLNAGNAITVAQGDTINATVTLNAAYTIPASPDHTDFLLYLLGSAFPQENTGDTGMFNFYNGGALVRSFVFGSTTSGQISTYAALFPPNNTSFTFDSFTNDFTIDTLAQPATLDSAFMSYSIVSPSVAAVPEPVSWAMMVGGFGLIGTTMRRRQRTDARFV